MENHQEPISVLHIDDEPGFADMAAEFLERADDHIRVETAQSAEEGLDRITTQHFDCVVSDYDMPGRDGIEFLEAVREDYPDLPFILYTGKGSEEVASDAISAGVTDYLQKGSGGSQYEVLANRIRNAVDRFQTERALAATRQRYEKLVEQNLAGIYIIQDGEFVYVNPKLAENHGYAQEEVIGMTPMELTAPEERDRVQEYVQQRLDGETEDIHYETVGLTKDGHRIHIELHGSRIEYRGAPAVIGTEIDITERKERQQELETMKDRMTHALDVTDSIIFENDLDSETWIRHGPFERLFGFGKEEVSSNEEFYSRCVHPEDRDHLREARSELLSGDEERISVEFRTHPDHGEQRWISLEGYLQTGPDGTPRRLIGLDTDITDRKERERALEAQRNELQIYQRAVEGASAFLAAIDTEYNYLFANERYREYHGLSGDEVAGQSVPAVLGEQWESEIKPRVDRALAGEEVRYEMERREGDGSVRRFEIEYLPLRNDDGAIAGVVGGMRDVTARTDRDEVLEREKERFRTLFENTNDAVAWVEYVDNQPVIRDANPAFKDLFEPMGESVEDRPMDEIVASEDRRSEAAELSRRVRAGDQLSAEITRDTVDGPRTFRWEAVPMEDPTDGEINHAFAVYSDISDLRERERELERFQTIIEAIGDTVYTLDEDGRYTYVNDAFLEQTGYNHEEIIGAHVSKVTSDEYVEQGRSVITTLLKKDEQRSATWEFERQTAEGEWVPVENHVALLPMHEGEFRGTAGVVRDISDRRERERELERYETIIQALGDPVYVIDADGKYTFVNEAYVEETGYDREAVIGEHVSKVLPDEYVEKGQRIIEDLWNDPDRKKATWELERRSADGDLVPAENHVALLPTDDGRFRGTAGVVRDISERKERQRELRRQNERLEEFASVVSHDLRNPLSVAQGRLQLAIENGDVSELDTVAGAHDRMETLIEDMLSLANAGEAVGALDAVALSDLAEECWHTVETEAATLRVETEGTIQADRSRLQQLLENLLRNAIEHGGDAVTITIGSLPDGFYVEDDGVGIPLEDRDRVLELGYSTREDGTGFGLSIVRDIAEAHEWQIDVTEGADGGARFEFRI
ncbi:MAG: PAS domain S-box protein [Halobacteriales archaeon]